MTELFRATDKLTQVNFRVPEAMAVASLYYLLLTALRTSTQNALERRHSVWFFGANALLQPLSDKI